jgi:serine/threonine protein kinase
MDLRAGETIDRYVVEERLGQGGMAVVYRVRHAQLGTSHALKVLAPSFAHVRDRLLQEGRIQAQLMHPNVVRVTDVVDMGGDGVPGLVMDFVPGRSLEDRLTEESPLPLEEVDRLMRQILAGVAAAHAAGVVHRDLKPANVLLAPGPGGETVRVADFGLAKVLQGEGADLKSSASRSGIAMGTPTYMAPEQIRDAKNVDHRADVFALGAIAYELLSGHRAYDRPDVLETYVAIASGDRKPIRELCPDAPERMVATIDRALEIDRDWRWSSVQEMAEAWAGNVSVAPRPAEPRTATLAPPPTSSSSSLPPRRIAAMGVFAASLLVLAGIAAAGAIGLAYTLYDPREADPIAAVTPPPEEVIAEPVTPPKEEPAPAAAAVADPEPPPVVEEAPRPKKAAKTTASEPPPPEPVPVPAQPRRSYKVAFNSHPVSEVITVNGETQGTPWRGQLPEGKHKVSLKSADGRTATREVVVSEDMVWCWDFDLGAECPR